MQINLISMDRDEAKRVWLDYRRAIKKRHGSLEHASESDKTLLRAHRELARGRQVLDLVSVIRSTGQNDASLPLLAVCRADAQWCRCQRGRDGAITFHADDPGSSSFRFVKSRGDIKLPPGTLPELPAGKWGSGGRAMVPEIPIFLRPEHGLANYHVLWEATWVPEPPGDPFLLRHLGSTLYAVLAQWDLSPIEQAVLRGLRVG